MEVLSMPEGSHLMPRIRTIKPDFFSDEDVALLPFEAQRLFIGLWCYADRDGRLEDRPQYLKAMIFPYNADVDVENCLRILAKPKARSGQPLIFRYRREGVRCIQILNFLKHQRPHHTEQPSRLPSPEEIVEEPFKNCSTTVQEQEGREGKGRERKGKEGKGRGSEEGGTKPPPTPHEGALSRENPFDDTAKERQEKVRRVAYHLKIAMGVETEDLSWDETNIPKLKPAIEKLLDRHDGNVGAAGKELAATENSRFR